ncbi:LOW QUALITY PROTEIN: cytochrome P450 704B1 [Phalaenopsis equestris]|uniref:LOW QUALITY PROTEIN: cytochrome P450 704B1 n=1 Tax=Phalaenopsis equestris TaxID=78828 RepID=UPI0009E4C965|nr:LOW QUALITY PROTEIN: cytochrome P450 704B1 [Phalaenopsis equestris]
MSNHIINITKRWFYFTFFRFLNSHPPSQQIYEEPQPQQHQSILQPLMSSSSSSSSLLPYNQLIAFTVVFLISWILLHRWVHRNRRGPKTWPLVGAAIEQLNNYERMHDWLAGYLSEWRTVTVPMPFTSYTYTADPANVEHILKTNFSNYPKGEIFRSYMEVLLGDGIFNADGELWRKQRKTASFEFASKNLRELSTVVFREYALKLSNILCQASSTDHHQAVDIQDLFMRMTMDSICKLGFGVEIGTLSPQLPDNSFARAFDTANETVTLRFIDPLWRLKRFLCVGSEAALKQNIKIVDDFTSNVIRTRKAEILRAKEKGLHDNKVQHDILSRFIELSGADNDNESDFGTEKSLRDVVINFVIAGRDTTAATLSWFIYMLVRQPQVAEKLYTEMKEFEEMRAGEENINLDLCDLENEDSFRNRLSHFSRLLDYDSVGRLQYLHACITETLRLYPPVPQDPKGILKDDVLPDGTKVRAGEMVTYVPYSMGRMEYIWGIDASEFRPERWLNNDNISVQNNVSPFKFTAFQAGPRMCLGKDSAYLQMKMTAALLCRFFQFRLAPHHPPVKYRMMAILSMAQGLHVLLCRRGA